MIITVSKAYDVAEKIITYLYGDDIGIEGIIVESAFLGGAIRDALIENDKSHLEAWQDDIEYMATVWDDEQDPVFNKVLELLEIDV